jgi:hypothetical protein
VSRRFPHPWVIAAAPRLKMSMLRCEHREPVSPQVSVEGAEGPSASVSPCGSRRALPCKTVAVNDRALLRGLTRRVLFVWTTGSNGVELPIACCCWHVHRGNWPLCVLDAGWSRSLKDPAGVVLVERALFGALRQLAADAHLRDTHEPRPSERIGWRVNHEEGAGSLQARRAWARAVARRAQQDFRFARLEKNKRPTWARVGFYGERAF